ncbi:uncharacterized protein LOC117641866 [Thrips palmi]|uniref:Uncharacterized protein LOC117641866 n=1 Tax=Thrips palmi TaxID=161013 RepID=A0A6P8YG22_THRPL|nr:uncharacterized protein LOC117641866 [Thrips palmi]XP_034235466.1 uncharacterized protein LOC117641866 [Thrips palmi]
MPKVKSESTAERRSEGSGWQGGQLFGSENTETTFTGGGFKDKEKAKETLKLLDGRDINYQYQVINSMFNRAKVILKRTKDAEKVKNLQEAVSTFEDWLDDYKTHSRSKENFGYLPLDTVHAFERLAKEQGVLNGKGPTFLQVYEEADGDLKKLRVKKVDGADTTWDIHRNRNLKPLVEKLNKDNEPLYTSKGQPSKQHLALIVWGYSPEAGKVKKLAAAGAKEAKKSSSEDESS